MKIQTFTFNDFAENTYILYDETKECIIIDPGCYTIEEQNILTSFIHQKHLIPTKVLNTHCHIDHILGNKFVCNKWNIDLFAHEKELPLLQASKQISKMYGFDDYKLSPMPHDYLNAGQTIKFGYVSLDILFCPGHSPGHICFYSKKNNFLIGGDVIFKGSIGRTDLPGGDYEILIESINKEILPLPNETQIFPGHGIPTSLSEEKKHNPFIS